MANTYDGVKNSQFPVPRFEASPPARQFLEVDDMPPLANITLAQSAGIVVACSGSQPSQSSVPSPPTQYWS